MYEKVKKRKKGNYDASDNREKAFKARMSVLEVLSDGKWHRTQDLKVNTHVSPNVLYKNLKRFEGQHLIERREDKTTYPHPTYYKATLTLLSLRIESVLIENITKAMMEDLTNTKDLQSILCVFNGLINAKIKSVLSAIKKEKITESEMILFLLKSFVFPFQEILTTGIVKASLPIINELDLEKNIKRI